jgi:hypothetical protein
LGFIPSSLPLVSVREKEGRLLGDYADSRGCINWRAQHPKTFKQAAANFLRGAVIGAALYTGFAIASSAISLFISLSTTVATVGGPAGGGRIFTHFTDAEGLEGITGLTAESLTAGQAIQVGELAFGAGQNPYLATQAGAIFVTELGPAATAGQLQQIGVFGAQQQYAIQFSEEVAFTQGARVVGVLVERSIYAMSANSTLVGTFTVMKRF